MKRIVVRWGMKLEEHYVVTTNDIGYSITTTESYLNWKEDKIIIVRQWLSYDKVFFFINIYLQEHDLLLNHRRKQSGNLVQRCIGPKLC